MEEAPKVPTSVLKRFDFFIIAVIVYVLNACSSSAGNSKIELLQEEITELKQETLKLNKQVKKLANENGTVRGSN